MQAQAEEEDTDKNVQKHLEVHDATFEEACQASAFEASRAGASAIVSPLQFCM